MALPHPVAADAATADAPGHGHHRPAPRAGYMTGVWRVVMVVAWVAVVLSWSAVWSVAVQLGQPTWWLGTRASPTSPAVRLAPFLGPVALICAVLANARWLAWGGVAAALVFAAYGLGDLDHRSNLGWVELAIAAAGLIVSLAALSGTYRASPGERPG